MRTIKAVNRIYLSLVTLFVISISSCSDNVTNSPDNRDAYEIKVWDYSDNHYFLDTLYKQSFLNYYEGGPLSLHTDSFAVDEQNFEVWVQTDVTTINYRRAVLNINLPALPVNGYDDTLRIPISEQGVSDNGIVRKLSQSEYVLNKYAGYISLKINLPENYFAGVAYRRPVTGEQFGTISTDTNALPTGHFDFKNDKGSESCSK